MLVAAIVMAVAPLPAGAADQDDLRTTRAERQKLNETIEELERSDEQLEALLVALEVQVIEAEVSLRAAESHMDWAAEREGRAARSVQSARVAVMRASRHFDDGVLDAYVKPPSDLLGSVLLAEDADDAGRRSVLVGAVLSVRQESLRDMVEAAELSEGTLEAAADISRVTRAALVDVDARRAEVVKLEAAQTAARAELQERIEQFRDEADALAKEERELVALIQRQAAQRVVAAGGSPSRLQWPASGIVSSEFGPRWGRNHNGLDVAAGTGTPVVAAASGVVTWAGPKGSFGNLVMLDHGGLTTLYAHLNSVDVGVGDRVTKGQRVATVGSTGRSTGPHLHFEVRVGGVAANPRGYLP